MTTNTNTNNKQSFVMYASFYDAAVGLNDEDFREYILALKDYALYGIEHTSQNTMINGLLAMAQPNLDAARIRWAKNAKNGDYGILGGRPRKGETAAEYKARKEVIRQSLNLKITQDNPMGFQTKTLNVDVNENVKEDDNWNEKGNVNLTANENLNVDENANGNAERDEKEESRINTIQSNPSSIVSFNSNSSPSQLPILETASEGQSYSYEVSEDDSNSEEFNEQMKNCLGTIKDIMQRLSLNDPSNKERGKESSTQRKEGIVGYCPSKDKIERTFSIQRSCMLGRRNQILEEEEDYCDGAYNIINNDMAVLRRCLATYCRGKGERVGAALNKLHELVMDQSPLNESEYTQIVKDLYQFYIRDKAFWDSKANTDMDYINPYLHE